MQDLKVIQTPYLESEGTATPSNFISQFYDLHGPSESTDASSSSNLVSLHQGCQTIHSGESEVSIVGAASTNAGVESTVNTSIPGLNGGDAKDNEWDERSQTCEQGGGAVALVLKSLDAALRDGDRVHCVIRASILEYVTLNFLVYISLLKTKEKDLPRKRDTSRLRFPYTRHHTMLFWIDCPCVQGQ